MKPLVYVAGPYTNPDPVENVHAAIRYANRVLELGAVPIIPHLSAFWHLVTPKPYEEWLAIDLDYLYRCDVVLRFPGASSGADAEVDEAVDRGIPVVFSIPGLAHLLDELRAEGQFA